MFVNETSQMPFRYNCRMTIRTLAITTNYISRYTLRHPENCDLIEYRVIHEIKKKKKKVYQYNIGRYVNELNTSSREIDEREIVIMGIFFTGIRIHKFLPSCGKFFAGNGKSRKRSRGAFIEPTSCRARLN